MASVRTDIEWFFIIQHYYPEQRKQGHSKALSERKTERETIGPHFVDE